MREPPDHRVRSIDHAGGARQARRHVTGAPFVPTVGTSICARRRVRELIRTHDLTDLSKSISEEHTYINNDLGHYSHIDHALVKTKNRKLTWLPTNVCRATSMIDGLNSSYHVPIGIQLNIPETIAKKVNSSAPTTRRKFFWDQMDTECFKETLDAELSRYQLDLLESGAAIEVLNNIIYTASVYSTPSKESSSNRSNKEKNKNWTPELAEAVQESKRSMHLWRQAGEPRGSDPTWIARRTATRKVRSVQRRANAEKRKELKQMITDAAENDPRLFHELIRRQREEVTATTNLYVDGRSVTDDDEIREIWADYYESLSDAQEESEANTHILQYLRILTSQDTLSLRITDEMLNEALTALKNRKAADRRDIVAEQAKQLTNTARLELKKILQKILDSGHVPEEFKISYKLPIPKKGKDSRLLDNYRGISVSSIFCKVLEMICMSLGLEEAISSTISDLQFGFSKGRSPTMASLLITESILEARSKKLPLYVASLDARKAFDVVNHFILKKKLYNTDVDHQLWRIVDDMYVGLSEVIRWKSQFSRPFLIKQGVKQGGILSPVLYKLYVNDLLSSIEKADFGAHIGITAAAIPTCADDVLLLSNDKHQLQAMLDACFGYSKEHGYELHPQKSLVCQLVGRNQDYNQWLLGGKLVTVAESFVHLGMTWQTHKISPDIAPLVSSARRTAYLLLGTGLHGINGLDPLLSLQIITLYVIPRLLYGLEAAMLAKSDIARLDEFYRKLLRQIQGLPENTALEAIYLLLGTVPIEGILHRRILSLLGRIFRLPSEHRLHKIAVRQLAISQSGKTSWFHYADNIASEYDINIHDQLANPWPKSTWKTHVNERVTKTWHQRLLQGADGKSTLDMMLFPQASEAHSIWQSCKGDPTQVERATTRARMAVGRYRTQQQLHKFSGGSTSAICPMCEKGPEDLVHLLADCSSLERARIDDVEKLRQIYHAEGLPPPTSPHELTSAIVNGTRYSRDRFNSSVQVNSEAKGSRAQRVQGGRVNDTIRIGTEVNRDRSNRLANQIVYRLDLERDHTLQSLHNGGSPL